MRTLSSPPIRTGSPFTYTRSHVVSGSRGAGGGGGGGTPWYVRVLVISEDPETDARTCAFAVPSDWATRYETAPAVASTDETNAPGLWTETALVTGSAILRPVPPSTSAMSSEAPTPFASICIVRRAGTTGTISESPSS